MMINESEYVALIRWLRESAECEDHRASGPECWELRDAARSRAAAFRMALQRVKDAASRSADEPAECPECEGCGAVCYDRRGPEYAVDCDRCGGTGEVEVEA